MLGTDPQNGKSIYAPIRVAPVRGGLRSRPNTARRGIRASRTGQETDRRSGFRGDEVLLGRRDRRSYAAPNIRFFSSVGRAADC